MDPSVSNTWLATLMDPRFLEAVTVTLTDPGKLMRWVMAPLDPKVLSGAMSLMDPNTYAKAGAQAANPNIAAPVLIPLNPNWYGNWAGTAMAPQTYGPTYGNWMAAPMQVPAFPTFPMYMPAAPVAPVR